MQTLVQHITMLVALATVVISSKDWALNYAGIQSQNLGGKDRFEPTKEGYRE